MKNLLSIVLIFVLLISCGTRKTNKSKTEIKTEASTTIEASSTDQSQASKSTEKETTAATNQQNNILAEAENLEPINQDKPIIKTTETKDGKTTTSWENAKVNNSKNSDNSHTSTIQNTKEKIDEKKKNDLANNIIIKQDEKGTIDVDIKETERESVSMWWWSILLIPITLSIYYALRNRKSQT